MRILDITEVKLEWLDLSQLTQHKPKPYVVAPGTIGVTSILRYIATTIGTLKLSDEDVQDMPWRMLVGMGWETLCAQMYPDMKWPAKELKLGTIAGHPDANSWVSGKFGDVVLDDAFVVDEFKYTAKSLRERGAPATQFKDIRREWMWQGQMMSYIAMARKYYPSFAEKFKQPLLGRFHVMWAMGCYEKYTLDERYLRYLVEYEPQEIDRHWQMMEANEEGARKWMNTK